MSEEQQPITGYRKRPDEELALINDIKAHEVATAGLVARVRDAIIGGTGGQDGPRQLSIARTEFEGAFMRLTRAVARPLSPWK